MRITCIAVGASALVALRDFVARAEGRDVDWLELRTHYVGSDGFGQRQWEEIFVDIPGTDMLILDLMGATQEFIGALQGRLEGFAGSVVVVNASTKKIRGFAKLGAFSGKMMARGGNRGGDRFSGGDMMKMIARLEKLGKVIPIGPMRDLRNYLWLGRYWRFANRRNIEAMVRLIGREYGGLKDLPAPQEPVTIDDAVILIPDTDRTYRDFESFRAAEGWTQGLPGVVLLFGAGTYPANLHPLLAQLSEVLRPRFNVLPIALPRLTGAHREFFEEVVRSNTDEPRVDAVVNILGFRLGQGPMGGDAEEAVACLRELNLPLLHPFVITKRTEADWRADPRGVKPGEFVVHFFLPELDGAFQTIPLGAVEAEEGSALGRITLIDERIQRLAGKLEGLIRLRRTAPAEKRVAILMYNYPPGEASLGAAAFLDTFASVASITRALEGAGYDTTGWDANSLRETMIEEGILNSRGFSGAGSGIAVRPEECGLAGVPEDAAAVVQDRWGRKPSEYRMPVLERGKVLVGLQPSRTGDGVDGATYHDIALAPHHQYLAFYRWLEEGWGADAIVHVGTHGTLEFLPGKETATSGSCFPDLLPGNLPHFYIYYCGGAAESMIAKRRSHAVMVSHMEPPYVRAGSHGRLEALKRSIEEYHQAARTAPGRMQAVLEDIETEAVEAGLRFSGVHDLEDQLHELTAALVPGRMHVFGKPFSAEEAQDLADRVRELGGDINPDVLTRDGEIDALLHVLAGGYLEAGPAGDPTRMPEVVPTGRNMYQFDPRAVPSPSATRRGDEIAERTLSAYRDEKGGYPDSVAVVLWGLETAKTHGETVAQILAYLGVRLGPDHGLWESQLELIPIEELGRPRVDVTIQMSGFFRDLFPNLIKLLHDAVDLAAGAEAGSNVVGENAARIRADLLARGVAEELARDLSTIRLFGPHTSEYGTGLTHLVSESTWQDEAELAAHYQDRLRYAYGRDHYGADHPDLLMANLSRVKLVSQVRCSRDYEMTDLDHFYEFYGGLARSVRELSGKQAALLVSDTYDGAVRTEALHRAVERGAWSRLLNPMWLDGVLSAAHHGGQEIADRFENMLGLAATTGEVDTKLFDEACDRLILDETMRKRIETNNPYALLGVVERLLETEARGYWQAGDERLDALRALHAQLEGDLEQGV